MISLIAAIGKNRELGKDNDLLWHLKGDLKYFKEVTTNHTVVMGRKTYESIGKPLPNRENIVITRSNIDGVKTIKNPEEVLKMDGEVFIIGGASIYEYFIKYASRLYLTLIDDDKDADVYFPYFDESLYEKKTIGQNRENDIEYTFVLYERRDLK